jgi:hypothetical protein
VREQISHYRRVRFGLQVGRLQAEQRDTEIKERLCVSESDWLLPMDGRR